MVWLRRFERLISPLSRALARRTRGMTLGVRGVILDSEGRVLLVEHTYVAGWHLPGGGVERGETAEQALVKEMVEEAGVRVHGRPSLVSIHSAERQFRGDHVVVYRIDEWSPCPMTAHGEIRAVGWFAPDTLPDSATHATRRRLTEVLGGAAPSADW
jgi:ADP-ribose pyrophosphatase YjhB (NUDIX family)